MAKLITVIRENNKKALATLELTEEEYQFLLGRAGSSVKIVLPEGERADTPLTNLKTKLSICTRCGSVIADKYAANHAQEHGKLDATMSMLNELTGKVLTAQDDMEAFVGHTVRDIRVDIDIEDLK